MSSIDNSTRKAQQADLNELQAEYSRKKKDLIKSSEAELSELKDYYNDKRENLTEQNEAAINHIRRRPAEVAEQAAAERKRLSENYRQRNQEMEKDFEEKIVNTRDMRQKQIAETKENAQAKTREIEDFSADRIDKIRNQSHEEILKVKEKHNKDLTRTTTEYQKRLEDHREQNKETVNYEIERGKNISERVRARNEKEHVALQTRSEKQINEEQGLQKKKLEQLNESSAKRYDLQKKQWADKEERLNKDYTHRTVHTKEVHEDELKNQHQRFQSVYQKNENAQRDSLNIQKQRYVRELSETRKDFVKAADKYQDKEADPFYKVEDRGSYLRENPDFYVLRAYVPEHEKDVVRVTIQNDKATISGQRSFKDRLEDDGKIVSSANFQTFREEFPFEKPVITEGMTRERQGDWVVYQIPKGLANRLNRKA